jgi:hypothetical protein
MVLSLVTLALSQQGTGGIKQGTLSNTVGTNLVQSVDLIVESHQPIMLRIMKLIMLAAMSLRLC